MSKRILGLFCVFTLLACCQLAGSPSQSTAGGQQEDQKMQDKKQPTRASSAALLDPSKATETAPATFRVKLDTTKGPVVLEVVRDWAPRGADRFYNLVKIGFYKDVAFFRVINGFMAQFGIHGDPAVSAKWRDARIPDDPVRQSNLRGFVSFAMGGPNTRTTQLFINYADNARLDSMGFPPFARVIQGMENIDLLYSEYGEGAPSGAGPSQRMVQLEGNAYLRASFPKLDYIKTATIEP